MTITNKIYTFNHMLPELIKDVTNWHYERNLIHGTTDEKQAIKLLEEYTELVASLYPEDTPEDIFGTIIDWLVMLLTKERIKSVAEKDVEGAKKDALGDMMVVQVNIAERNGWTVQKCLSSSYSEIKDRGGMMVDGLYVKSEDMNNESL